MTPDGGIRAQGVRRSFGPVHAVADVDLVAAPGRVTALIGPNGSGKTTLLLMLAGLLTPDAGTISIAGADPVTQNYAARSRTGWMPDVFGTWDSPYLTLSPKYEATIVRELADWRRNEIIPVMEWARA